MVPMMSSYLELGAKTIPVSRDVMPNRQLEDRGVAIQNMQFAITLKTSIPATDITNLI